MVIFLREIAYNQVQNRFLLLPYHLLYCMSNHLQWFESPLPKPQQHQEHHPDPEQSHWNRHLDIYSPEPYSIFRLHNISNQLSPWSKILHSADHREEALSIPGIIDQQYVKKEVIEQRLIFSQEEDELATPVRKEQFRSELQGDLQTTGKKSQVEVNYNCNSKKSRPREKGLRKLSQRAFEIVKEFKNATYKQVAAKLVVELGQQDFEGELPSNIQNKEEQNIKRRVYDALNVLIALGVLRKEGRKIVSDSSSNTRKGQPICAEEKQLEELKAKMNYKRNMLQQKKKKLKESEQNYQSINKLFKRNKTLVISKDDKIQIPFIGVVHSIEQKPNKKRYCEQQGKKQISLDNNQFMTLRSQHRLEPFGDIDALKWLKIQVQKQLLQQNKQFS